MTKPVLSAAQLAAPMQEGLERLHQAAEKFSATCADVASHQCAFLQKTVFDELTEFQGLMRVRNPAEFAQLTAQFAWQQAERTATAWGQLCSDVYRCWIDALETTPLEPTSAPISRARR